MIIVKTIIIIIRVTILVMTAITIAKILIVYKNTDY